MGTTRELQVVERITSALRDHRGVPPALRSELLRLPRPQMRAAGAKLGMFSLALLMDDPERWRNAIIAIGDLLYLIETTGDGDQFERR